MLKVLKGGRLIDGTGAGPAAGATIVIRDGRIDAVTTRAADQWPDDAEIIDQPSSLQHLQHRCPPAP